LPTVVTLDKKKGTPQQNLKKGAKQRRFEGGVEKPRGRSSGDENKKGWRCPL